MRRHLFLLLICTALTSMVYAQTGTVLTFQEAGNKGPLAELRADLSADAPSRTTGNITVDPLHTVLHTDAQGRLYIERALLPAIVRLYDEQQTEIWQGAIAAGAPDQTIRISPKKIGIRRTNALQEVVVTGVPMATKLKNALSQYRIISMEESKAQGNITLADALATQLNISLSNDQVLGTNVKMQGLNGAKIKVLIDGLPVNGRENGNIDMGQINLNNIARVEIVQGPMSVVYGSDALGGVINLITKKQTRPWSVNGGFNYESVGKYNADLGVSRSWKRHQVSLGGGRNYFKGWNDLDTVTTVPHRLLQWKPKEQYLANGAYTYTADSGFRLQLASDFVKEKVTNRGSINPVVGYAFDEYYRTTRSSNRLIMEGKIGKKGHWESRNGYALYHRVKERVRKDMVTLDEVLTQQSGDQDTSTFNDFNLRSNYSNTLGRLRYDAGYDVNLQFAKSGKIPGGTHHVGDYAIYENFSYGFLKDKLTLQAGLRQIYNTQYDAPFIYSFQALYTPAEHLQLRASYGRGFRAPSLKEQYLEFIDQNHHITGNPDLKAEQSDALQVSASWQAYEQGSNYLQFIVTGFYNNVTNQITLAAEHPEDPNSTDYIYANIDRVRNVIGNLQVEDQWKDLHVVLEYSLKHVWGQATYPGFNASEIVARGQYYWRQPALTFSAFYKLTGAMPNIIESVDGSATLSGSLPAYSMLDASVSRKCWKKRVELIAGVKNILDVRQVSAMGVTGGGGAHASDNGGGGFLPRRFFTTVRLNLH